MVETALLMPVLLLVLVGVVDFGQAYYVEIEVGSAAQSGAAYGVLNPTDTAGMQSAALLDASDVPTMTAVATYGCECSDGTGGSVSCGVSPNCLVNMVNYIDVSTSVNFKPMMVYPLVPATMVLKGHSRMRVAP
ncbi:TadE/TadG family type IV pilus assembly protein [Granulicella tundricola]|uniref:TadE family protein n=1 Tax=Granulicella tundricola (strain ATCC BAA-1859 / DSM 23138 / MP5ACTX9) TaxID=1198114 RepID=E8X5M9_GRATM|nr:TadE/TadG family type IV pilus assembly protein [Granulicella tundricola]ADW70656.1 TadE family protein [Granulicella tundricola MP5ACTX9]